MSEQSAKGTGPQPGGCSAGVELDFSTFVVSIGTSALVGLGVVDNPESGERHKDLDIAKQNIDILAVLCDKTKGNLSGAEEKLLRSMLYDLRMAYVRAVNETPK